VEPLLFEGYDPHRKMVLHQIALEKRMAAVEVADKLEGEEFVRELGAKNCDLFQRRSDGQWMIQLREGAVLSIPKALRFDRFVAGQIPTGWDAERLGVPKDIAQAVDPVTLFALVSAAEALVSAGICDPYEFYEYVHLSDVGNTMGGGMGGMRSLRRIYRDRALGVPVPNDSLQECFINTMPAWINMLMLSSCGPIKTPVGACATAAESVEIGMETILSGKARVVLVGGYDDFGEEGSYEFAQMKATSDTNHEVAMGRDPREMCRPCTDTRGGFMEAQGCGVQVLMDAALALQMGCPIHAIVALTNTSTDGQGRSVPAPGQGVLSTARECHESSLSGLNSPLLDVHFRRQQLSSELEFAAVLKQREVGLVEAECASLASNGASHSQEDLVRYRLDRTRLSEQVHEQRVKSAQQMWGNDFFKRHPDIAPLRGALSVWGLSVDDIAVASFHGTGTKANDKNESDVTHKQMQHLGRSRGNPLMVICQKWLTGHPKGAAAGWMFNGLLQVLETGLVPGNRNNDNTCKTLRPYSHLVYPNRAVQTEGVKAAILKSFGFGQAGGEILLVHPERLFAAVSPDALDTYLMKRRARETKAHQYMQGVFTDKHKFVQVKSEPPYKDEDRAKIFLDPTARATYHPAEGSWKIAPKVSSARDRLNSVEEDAAGESLFVESQSALPKQHCNIPAIEAGSMSTDSASLQIADSMQQAATMLASTGDRGIGIDAEPISTFQPLTQKKDFVERNFTRAEREYCLSAPDPAASFAGRWAAKEAVVKALCCSNPRSPASWKDSGASLSDIEVGKSRSGAPFVSLHGNAKIVFQSLGLTQIQLSISHTDTVAVAQAVVR
jgi:fatty acid synthase subunit alpha